MDAGFVDLRPLFPYVGPVPRLWGATRPVSIPQAYLGPYDGEFGVGDRVWWYRFGEWVLGVPQIPPRIPDGHMIVCQIPLSSKVKNGPQSQYFQRIHVCGEGDNPSPRSTTRQNGE